MPSVSFEPIGAWWIVAIVAAVVTALTLWAYSLRLRQTNGAWRWFALGLRLAAILLCLIAALRPSVVFQEKKKQPTSIYFLVDGTRSMTITDEIRGQRRWDVATKALEDARAMSSKFGEGVTAKFFRFDTNLRELPDPLPTEPEGRATALGVSMLEAFKREGAGHIASIVLLTDGSNNDGIAPLLAAKQLKSHQVPVIAVPFGSEDAGGNSRDLAVRELVGAPTVFMKNQIMLKGNLLARGYAGQTIEAELYVEGQDDPISTKKVKVPTGTENVAINFTWIPQKPGEKRLTFKVKPKSDELLKTNNEISTYVTVLKGGLNVFFIQGPAAPWEGKFWLRSVGSSPDIHGDLRILRNRSERGIGELRNEEFVQGKYDAYVLSDIAANYLTPEQHSLIARAVEKGAGLIMLGGRSSFGPGGWGSTALARVLPVEMHPGDGQLEPDGGVKFTPNPKGLESYVLQVGTNKENTAKIWAALPPLSGISRLSAPKLNATVLAQAPGNRAEPIMVGMEVQDGRSLAFGGETWVWSRDLKSDEGRTAHRRFWRQVIFWLCHKEDKGANDVKLTLDSRRIATGQKLDFGVTARDSKGAVLTGLKYETRVEKDATPDGGKAFSEPVDVFETGETARGTFFAKSAAEGEYRVSVVAIKDDKEIGRDSARFVVFQDDRELETPAADHAILRQIATASGGQSVTPEQLPKYLQSLQGKIAAETYTQTERKIWDNWPFLLLFATLLTIEWWVRKRHGWV